MASSRAANQQTLNTQLILVGFAAMTVAFAFVAIITNIVVNSKVNALSKSYQSNPVTVAAAPQTNTVTAASCVDPATTVSAEPAASGGQTNTLPWGGPVAPAYKYILAGNYSSNQSNSSVTNTTSNNTFIKDSYNTTNRSMVITRDNGNTFAPVATNNTNTTTTTTNNTDNSNNSVNTNTNTSTTTTTQDNGNTNAPVFAPTTNTNTTTNTDNSNNSVNIDHNLVIL